MQRYVEAQCCIASNDYKGWSIFVNIRLFFWDNRNSVQQIIIKTCLGAK